jgi:hypothetical protein
VVNNAMREHAIERSIAGECVGAKQADFLRYRASYKGGQGRGINAINDASHNLAVALDSADDWGFTGTDATSSTSAATLSDVTVLRETLK